MDIPPENNHEAEVLTRYNPNPEYKNVVGFLTIDGRKSRNLDIYKITHENMNFIGRYERFVDPNFDLVRPIGEEPYLLFTILFKRGQDLNINLPGFNVSRSYTYTYSYPWIKPEVPYCLKLEKVKDKNIIDEVDPCEIINPRLEITLSNLSNGRYFIEYSDYLDNNGLIEVFNEEIHSIEYASVKYFSTMDTKDASSMDTSGGKRRKSRRRTKKRRKGKKARKSRRYRK
jgi:hypothetical protein